jgi:hypothetical protein
VHARGENREDHELETMFFGTVSIKARECLDARTPGT